MSLPLHGLRPESYPKRGEGTDQGDVDRHVLAVRCSRYRSIATIKLIAALGVALVREAELDFPLLISLGVQDGIARGMVRRLDIDRDVTSVDQFAKQ